MDPGAQVESFTNGPSSKTKAQDFMRREILAEAPARHLLRCLWPHLNQSHPEKGLTDLIQSNDLAIRPRNCMAERKRTESISVPLGHHPLTECGCGGGGGSPSNAPTLASMWPYTKYIPSARVNPLPEG